MKHAATKEITQYTTLDSPVGPLCIAGDPHSVLLIGFSRGRRAVTPCTSWRRDHALYPEERQQIVEYFGGKRTRLELSFRLIGTPFQKSVWQALLKIPFGKTTTYRNLAEMIGRPKAARAIGRANGANPLPIIVPCHRAVGSNGALTGFGGGLEAKRFLLDLEARAAS